ncbi:MAG: extracellular solute-binding protein [Cyanobacteria bacterium J06639_16]
MDRRKFLGTATALAVCQGLSACGGVAADGVVRISLLDHTIPDQLIRAFRQQYEGNLPLKFEVADQLANLYEQLLLVRSPAPPLDWLNRRRRFSMRFWRRQSKPADLVSLNDYWLAAAIRQKLILPLDTDSLDRWSNLAPRWQALVRRDASGMPAADEPVWGAPYRWGSLMMVYRDRPFQSFAWTPTDWGDLWASELAGQISLPANPRLVLGLVLKKLGKSANSRNLDAQWPEIEAEMKQLHRQVKFYSSDNYLQALVTKSTTLAVGWSTDILPALKRNRDLRIAIPNSGTLLSADVWVKSRPQSQFSLPNELGSGLNSPRNFRKPLLKPWTNFLEEIESAPLETALPTPQVLEYPLANWIDFFWGAQAATQLSVSNQGSSPLYTSRDAPELPEPLRDNLALLPTTEIYKRSEFLYPLDYADQKRYRDLLNLLHDAD